MKKLFITLVLLSHVDSVKATERILGTEISFKKDVRPIFKAACTKCHSGQNNLPSITDYKVAYKLQEEIMQRVVVKRDMPFYTFLSESDRETVKAWVTQGAKQ